jgi:hypothetical protein
MLNETRGTRQNVKTSMQELETVASISVQTRLVDVGMFQTDVCTVHVPDDATRPCNKVVKRYEEVRVFSTCLYCGI